MDYLSKDLGVFPQGQKINTRKVLKISPELKKEFSDIPANIARKLSSTDKNFKKIKRIFLKSVSKKPLQILNISSFKYALNRLGKDKEVLKTCYKLTDKYPELSFFFCSHFSLYKKQKRVVNFIVKKIKDVPIYDYVLSRYWEVLIEICDWQQKESLKQLAIIQFKRLQKKNYPETINNLILFLGKTSFYKSLISKLNRTRSNEKKFYLLLSVYKRLTARQKQKYLNNGLASSHFNLANLCAVLMVIDNVKKTVPINKIHSYAQNILVKNAIIKRPKNKIDTLRSLLIRRFKIRKKNNFEKKFGKVEYRRLGKSFILADNYYESDATSWVGCINSFNAYLLKVLYDNAFISVLPHPPRNFNTGVLIQDIGKYLYSTDLRTRYPKVFRAFVDTNELRKRIPHTHPIRLGVSKIEYAKFVTDKERKRLFKKLKLAYVNLTERIN